MAIPAVKYNTKCGHAPISALQNQLRALFGVGAPLSGFALLFILFSASDRSTAVANGLHCPARRKP